MASALTSSDSFIIAQPQTPFNWANIVDTSVNFVDEWLDVEVVRYQLQLYGDSSQDDYLIQLMLAARIHIEDMLGKPILPRSYSVYYRKDVLAQNYGDYPVLNVPEIANTSSTITSVQYYDQSVPPVLQTLDPVNWFYDPTANNVILTGQVPEISSFVNAPIVVNVNALPSTLLANNPAVHQAALLLITHWYNNRSDTSEGVLRTIPHGFDRLLRKYRDLVF